MRIAVFGLGYVGVVSAACLARDGHLVTGVDPQQAKLDAVAAGRSPIVEDGVEALIRDAVAAGRLDVTADPAEAVAQSEMSLVCVGTPSNSNGSLDTGAVARVSAQIGAAVAARAEPHTVVMRSTILPGTMRGLVMPTLREAAGDRAGLLSIANNPEFLRESTAVADYDEPPKTVVGADEPETAKRVLGLYDGLPNAKIATTPEIAEMVKYVDNAWHAAKVSFGNEVGAIAKALGIDGHEVMEIFCQDRKLNISPAYLKPGFAFGGSCLPKDVRALTYRARSLDLELPLLESLMRTNALQIERAVDRVLSSGKRKVSMLGISFKAGTDDLRESPQVHLVERLIGKGIDLRIYDRNVHMARLVGANRDYIVNSIPHISSLLSEDLAETVAHGDLVILGNGAPEFAGLPDMLREDQTVFDLVRIGAVEGIGERYDGVCW